MLIAVLLLNLGLGGYRLAEPVWEAGGHGFVLAEYPYNALNYLRYGYVQTRLGLVMNPAGSNPQEGFRYRVDHGPLTSLLISFAYRLFGVHEWSARLFPVLLSVGTAVVTFFLTRDLTDNRWSALLALFFCALSPMQIYYARLPAPHTLAVFFCMLMFYAYWHWFTTGHSGYLASIFIVLTLGAYTDWIAYFTVMPMLIHYLVFCQGQRNWRFVIALTVSPLALFASYTLWTYWLTDGASLQKLWSLLLFKTVSSANEVVRVETVFTAHELWDRILRFSKYWLTLPVLALAIGWLVGFGRTLINRQVSPAQGLIAALFFFGLSHNAVFVNRIYHHDMIMLGHLVPVFAIAAASALTWLVSRYWRRNPLLVTVAVLAIGGLFGEQSVGAFRWGHKGNGIIPEIYYVGQALNETVAEGGKVLDASDLVSIGGFRLVTIADRSRIALRTEDKPATATDNDPLQMEKSDIKTVDNLLRFIDDDPAIEAMVVNNDSATVDTASRKYLVEHYPRQDLFGYSIFAFNQSGSNVLVQNPSIEHPARTNFGNQIEFLGFDMESVMTRQDSQIGWLERYFSPHAEFLPQHRTTFRVVNYWRKLTEGPTDYTLLTQFNSQIGPLYRLEQSYAGLDDLYPTSLWSPGQIIREEFEVEVPPDYPSLKYAMWVGVKVKHGADYLAPHGSDLPPDEDNRVKVSEIDIQPAQRPQPLPTRPQPQIITEIQINQAVSLLGYDLNVTEAGIRVTTYWEKLASPGRDYEFVLGLRNGSNTIERWLDLDPPRLWQVGQFYRGQLSFSPHLLDGVYDLYLVARDEQGQQFEFPLTTINWHRSPRRALVRQIGQPDASAADVTLLSPSKPLLVEFELSTRQDAEVLIGWTGQSQFDQTRIQVFAHNDQWPIADKYLQTLVVYSNQPTISRIKIPSHLTLIGRNAVKFTISHPTLIGWRQALATIIPDLAPLLRPSYLPYAGWIEPDFVQVQTSEWQDTQDTYLNLASVYASKGMYPEVIRLHNEMVEKGISVPTESLGIFVEAFYASGDYEKANQMSKAAGLPPWLPIQATFGEMITIEKVRLRDRALLVKTKLIKSTDTNFKFYLHAGSQREGQGLVGPVQIFDFYPVVPISQMTLGESYVSQVDLPEMPGYLLKLGLFNESDPDLKRLTDSTGADGIFLEYTANGLALP